MQIKRWLSSGGIPAGAVDTETVLHRAGRVLDTHATQELLGDILFEGEDGKFYAVFVEAVVTEVAEDHIHNVLGTVPDEDDTPRGACIITGAPGENPDDCTTHDHEPT